MEMQPKLFSIIISIYNAEKYLEDTINSVINQTIGFNRIELFLINDGSTDKSLEICERFEMRHPDNITVIDNPHQGVSRNRNIGLQLAAGEYVNFLDADDKLSLETLENVHNFFEKEKHVKIVGIPVIMFEDKLGLHHKYHLIGNKTRVIDLEVEAFNYISAVSACFYRRDIIENVRFNETMYANENVLFNLELFLDNPLLGYLSEEEASYFYRKRKDNSAIMNNEQLEADYYLSLVTVYETIKVKIGNNPALVEEVMLYSLNTIINSIDEANMNDKIREDLKKTYQDILKEIDISKIIKPMFHNEFSSIVKKLAFLNNKPVKRIIKIQNNKIYYEGLELGFNYDELSDQDKELIS